MQSFFPIWSLYFCWLIHFVPFKKKLIVQNQIFLNAIFLMIFCLVSFLFCLILEAKIIFYLSLEIKIRADEWVTT